MLGVRGLIPEEDQPALLPAARFCHDGNFPGKVRQLEGPRSQILLPDCRQPSPSSEMKFFERLAARTVEHGRLCVGIDPAPSSLALCGLPDSADGAYAFGERVLDSIDFRIALVKPQSAYFERFGSNGIRALEELTLRARRREVLVVLDAKRGDIDSTATAYADAYFSRASSMQVDAITLSPYLGLRAMQDGIGVALANKGGVFVVVRSSNPEGERLQTARQEDGLSVAETLCREIDALNRSELPYGLGSIGAVVGATCQDFAQTVKALPSSFILAPGVGAQGATLEALHQKVPTANFRVLPSVSRAILANGGSMSEIGATIRALQSLAQSD